MLVETIRGRNVRTFGYIETVSKTVQGARLQRPDTKANCGLV
jgi:hypothetical protein